MLHLIADLSLRTFNNESPSLDSLLHEYGSPKDRGLLPNARLRELSCIRRMLLVGQSIE